MVSGLYNCSLLEVKDYWKATGNRDTSFARNPEATSTWLALLQEHPKTPMVKLVVDYLPSMLDTDRLKRPSAREVMDKLHNLSLSTPEDPQYVNTCCGPQPGPTRSLHASNTEGAGLLTTRDPQLWEEFVNYFNAARDEDTSYIILDQCHNRVASKHDCYPCLWDTPGVTHRHLPYIANFSAVKDACDMLYLNSSKTRRAVLDNAIQRSVSFEGLNRHAVVPELLRSYAASKVIFTALSGKIRVRSPKQRCRRILRLASRLRGISALSRSPWWGIASLRTMLGTLVLYSMSSRLNCILGGMIRPRLALRLWI